MNLPENRRVLIVDDNEAIHCDFRKIIASSSRLGSDVDSAAAALFDDRATPPMANAGFDVDSAFQGQDALARVEQSIQEGRPYAVAFVDVRMPPGWDGIQTIQKLWQADADLQVVICTAYSDYSWNEMVEVLGETDRLLILKKPFDNIEVRQLAAALVAKRNLTEQAHRTMQELQKLVREQTRAVSSAHEETIHRLVRASLYRDEETGAHIRRTGLCSELMAATAGWASERVDQIRLAAPMHDVGKIGIPDAILCKPGKLTPEEFAIMQTHTELGAKMLAGSASPVLNMAQAIAMCHHERWDGTGYPAGLAGLEIPEEARIVAIVDVYDALSHDRVYRKAIPETQVLAMMKNQRGKHFDPRLFDIFMSLLPEMRAISQAVPDDDEATSPASSRTLDLPVRGFAGRP